MGHFWKFTPKFRFWHPRLDYFFKNSPTARIFTIKYMKSIFWTTNKVPKWVKFGKRILNGSVFGSKKDDNGWVSKSKISSYLSAKIPKYQPNPPPPPGNITFLDRYDSTRTALMFTEKGVFNRTARFFQMTFILKTWSETVVLWEQPNFAGNLFFQDKCSKVFYENGWIFGRRIFLVIHPGLLFESTVAFQSRHKHKLKRKSGS